MEGSFDKDSIASALPFGQVWRLPSCDGAAPTSAASASSSSTSPGVVANGEEATRGSELGPQTFGTSAATSWGDAGLRGAAEILQREDTEMPAVHGASSIQAFQAEEQEGTEAMWDELALELGDDAMEGLRRSISKAVDLGYHRHSRSREPAKPPAMALPTPTPILEKDPRMVKLKIYDLTRFQFVEAFNYFGLLLGLGGIFHVTIEVCNQEWSYGFSDSGSGVVSSVPGTEVGHRFRESVDLGLTPFSKSLCKCTMLDLAFASEWQGCNYDIVRHNCCHFARAVAEELGVQPLPDWVDRLSRAAERLLAHPCDAANAPEMVEVNALPASCRLSCATSGESLQECIASMRERRSL